MSWIEGLMRECAGSVSDEEFWDSAAFAVLAVMWLIVEIMAKIWFSDIYLFRAAEQKSEVVFCGGTILESLEPW